MKYTKKYLQEYNQLEEDKQFVLKLIRYIVYTLIGEYLDSDLYVRMDMLGIEGKRVYVDTEDKGLEFLNILELSFIEYGDKRIDVNLVLGQKVLEQDLDIFKQKLLKVIQDWQLRLDVKNCVINMSLKIECGGFAYFGILYVLAYRGLELNGIDIIDKPYYFLINFDKLTDKGTLYVDDDIVGDSVLVLYFPSLVRFCNSLNSLFFNCYTKKLLLHLELGKLTDVILLGILEKLLSCDTSYFSVYIDFKEKEIKFSYWFKLFKLFYQVRKKGIQVYFNIDRIEWD